MAGGQLVTVGCKIPNGLVLELPGKGGQPPRRVRLRGSAETRRLDQGGESFGDNANVIRGFGLTEVPEDFWEAWEAMYRKAGYTPLLQGLIFKQNDRASAQDHARDMGELQSGLEPADPTKTGPAPAEGVSKIEPLSLDA